MKVKATTLRRVAPSPLSSRVLDALFRVPIADLIEVHPLSKSSGDLAEVTGQVREEPGPAFELQAAACMRWARDQWAQEGPRTVLDTFICAWT